MRAASSSRSTSGSAPSETSSPGAAARAQRVVEPPLRLDRLPVESRELHLDGRHALGRLVGNLPELHLGRAQAPELRPELGGARRAGVDPRAHRGLEPAREGGGPLQRLAEARGSADKTTKQVDVEPAAPRGALEQGCVGRAGRVRRGQRPCRCVVRLGEGGSRLRREIVARPVSRSGRSDGRAPETGENDLGVSGPSRRLGRLASGVRFERAESPQVVAQLVRAALGGVEPRVHRSLETRRRRRQLGPSRRRAPPRSRRAGREARRRAAPSGDARPPRRPPPPGRHAQPRRRPPGMRPRPARRARPPRRPAPGDARRARGGQLRPSRRRTRAHRGLRRSRAPRR